MDKLLLICCFLIGMATMTLAFPEGLVAVLLTTFCSLIVIFAIRRQVTKEDAEYLVQLFLIALVARLIFGLLVHIFDLRDFFGGDAITYDYGGRQLVELWFANNVSADNYITQKIAYSPSGWGMYYMVGAIYTITGKNILAAQSFCAVIGAATAPMVYSCAIKIFNNRRVGKTSAMLVALYPAFIIWTGQLLKDGLIIFLLVLAVTLVLRLQEKLRYLDILILGLSLIAITTLRFYIFYMAALAIIGAFVVGASNSSQSMARRLVALLIIGTGLTYFGVSRNSGSEIAQYTNLERIQRSRIDLAKSAESGYGKEEDVSTAAGAFSALPIGLSYLMLAPFPWQMTNIRQVITLPEVLLWWASIPFLISGVMYAIRNKFRSSIPILVFSLLLTVAYSIFLGNVGTAYRQRTQIQVFLFMFIAAGWTLRQEKQENQVIIQKARKNNLRILK